MRAKAALAVALAFTLGEAGALAQSSVAVLGVEAVDAPAPHARCLTESLQNVIKQAPGLALVPGKDLDEIKLVFGCINEQPSCMARVGVSLHANKLLWGTLQKRGASYSLTLKLLDVAKASIDNSLTEDLDARSLKVDCASGRLNSMANSLLSIEQGNITIRANVAGARIMLGVSVIGVTGETPVLLRDMPAGTYKLQVTKEGYRTWERQLILRAGESMDVLVTLEPEGGVIPPGPGGPGGETPVPTRINPWRVVFWSAAVATVGLAVGFIVSGTGVWNAEDELDEIVSRQEIKDKARDHSITFMEDACDTDLSLFSELKDACDRGGSGAVITNVLIGLFAATFTLAGVSYYMGYIAKGSQEKPSPDTPPAVDETGGTEASPVSSSRSPAVRWRMTPSAGPEGAGLGFLLEF